MKIKKQFSPYDAVLDEEEKDILEAYEHGKLKRTSNFEEEVAYSKQASSNYLKKDKDTKINIRLSISDLLRIKEFAAYEGLPYQTLISSLLHKFAAGHFVLHARHI